MDALSLVEWPYAPLPRIAWIELTSKCPLRCVFCSRQEVRGNGADMEFGLFQRIIEQLDHPATVRLNYSGESIHYPHLLDAIRISKTAGASVELVTTLATAHSRTLRGLVDSGLDRLTVSLHTLDAAQYAQIYGLDRLADLRSHLRTLAGYKRAIGKTKPAVDFSFVAMAANLSQIARLAEFAEELGNGRITVHPVIRRDPIANTFDAELDSEGALRPAFIAQLRQSVAAAQRQYPEVEITVARPEIVAPHESAGSPCAPPSCEQNPWETIHILSNGDVVPCEVHERTVMGNAGTQDLAVIWAGERYVRFRTHYAQGRQPLCNACPWRTPALQSGLSGDLHFAWGWHESAEEEIRWGHRRSLLFIPAGNERSVTLTGAIPPPPAPHNLSRLVVLQDGAVAATLENRTAQVALAGIVLTLPARPSSVEFRMDAPYCPADAGAGKDQRHLGFGFISAEFDAAGGVPGEAATREAFCHRNPRWSNAAPRLWASLITSLDAAAIAIGKWRPQRTLPRAPARFDPGLSVVIPERGTPELLSECLQALQSAAVRVVEPVQVIVVVNGAEPESYGGLVRQYPGHQFLFFREPLGFSRAVQRGLSHAVRDWTYLLNSDVVVEPDTLAHLLPSRRGDVFAIGSQIFPYDPADLRVETNLTRFSWRNGMVETLELEPGTGPVIREMAYAGGGCSLFQTRLLRILAATTHSYDPFYWEDIEWGAVARRNGYVNLFCSQSQVRHHHRATIRRCYDGGEVSRILERNQFLFQVRNVPSLPRRQTLRFWLRGMPGATVRELMRPAVILESLRVRWASLGAPATGSQLFGPYASGGAVQKNHTSTI